MTTLDVLSYGGQVTLLGLAIVFTGLIILIVCITIMAKIFTAINNRHKDAPKEEAVPAPVIAPAPVVETPVIEETVNEGIDPSVIAVISAAIAAFDNSNKTLVVRSVRKVPNWNRVSRNETVCRF